MHLFREWLTLHREHHRWAPVSKNFGQVALEARIERELEGPRLNDGSNGGAAGLGAGANAG